MSQSIRTYFCLECKAYQIRPAKHPYKFCSVRCANKFNNKGERQRQAALKRWAKCN